MVPILVDRPMLYTVWDPHKGMENNGSYNLETVQGQAASWTLGRYQQLASVTEMLKELPKENPRAEKSRCVPDHVV